MDYSKFTMYSNDPETPYTNQKHVREQKQQDRCAVYRAPVKGFTLPAVRALSEVCIQYSV